MIRANGRPAHHRAWALGAAAPLVVSLAVAFSALFGSEPADAVTAGVGTNGPRYAMHSVTALSPVTAAPSASVPRALAAATTAGVHGPYSKVVDECVTCHRPQAGRNKNVLKSPVPQSTLCLTCHDGTGADTNVQAQYADPLVPANNDATRMYYRHDAVVTTSHTSAGLNEFGGVSNRHTECGDCHNPHSAIATDSTPTATGATASGRLAGISGVSVANGAAGTAPTYTFLDGTTNPITREYQLCFKCHSGFTTLSSNTGFTPSRYRLDKAVELNPSNPSYHPVEAPGTNDTQKMRDSLSGPAPGYKIWTFTTGSTIRCVSCHASSTKGNLVTPPSASGDLPMHTSKNPGILLQNYRNRLLKPAGEAYADADFALCFMCHANSPFTTETSTATNFSLHGLHVAGLGDEGSDGGEGSGGTDIDTPGAGGGNAICAECHFRLHSTTYKNGTQTVPGSRLVSFAPNVQPNGGTLSWTPGATGSGSCTLTCHGESHDR
ncbi:MAG: cytochrome c3 family protein [Dermatophilaceae bacterium]